MMRKRPYIQRALRHALIALCCLALPAMPWADIFNTASVTYQNSQGTPLSGVSNTVAIRFDAVSSLRITAVTPSIVTVGDPTVPIVLSGSFSPDAQIFWSDGTALASNWINTGRMDSLVPAGLLTSTGDFSISVRSPTLATSNAIPFNVVAFPVATFGASEYVLPIDSTLALETAVGVSFEWTFTSLPGTPAASAGSPARIIAATITHSPQVAIATLRLDRGVYTVSVIATNAAGKHSAPARTQVTLVSSDLSASRVYPNPWRAARGDTQMTFDQMPLNSTVKIFTVSARSVKTLSAPSGSVTWDLTNDSGERVASGIYLYLATDAEGHKSRGTFTVIR
jgi:hypothetical protein